MEKEKLIVYSTNCPRCQILESKLKDKNISFEICSDTAIMEQKNIVSVPMLEYKNELYSFGEAVKMINRGEFS